MGNRNSNMNISKKVPIIVSIVLVLLWIFLGFRSAMHFHGTAADPAITRKVTIAEDISVINWNEVYDADPVEKDYDHTTIPAGSAGNAWIYYGYRNQIINDPETDIHIFMVNFYLGENSIRTYFSTGPEEQLGQGKISIKKIENYQEIISEYNQKVREAKNEWTANLFFKLLISIVVAAVFSIVFWLECFIANKIKMNLVGFALICFVYVIMLLFALMFASIF